MKSQWIIIGGISGFLAVAAGAFGAHALAERLEGQPGEWYELAARYHLIHSVLLVAVGALAAQSRTRRAASVSGWCLLSGLLLFSGSLYLMALTGMRWLGAVTPFGGMLLLTGWLAAAWLGTRTHLVRRDSTAHS